MFCPFCGNQNRDGKKFCRQCGKQMPPARVTSALSEQPAETPPPAAMGGWQQLVEESLYNNFSQAATQPPSPPPTNPWQPDPSSAGDYRPITEELEEQLNHYTVPLLPDTVGFEVPKPGAPSVPVNGYERKANGHAAAPVKEETHSPPPSYGGGQESNGNAAEAALLEPDTMPGPVLKPEDLFDDNVPTDELEILDKTLDKTAEVPVLSINSRRAEPAKITASPPLPSFLPLAGSSPQLQVQGIRRFERIALFVAAGIALIGIALIIWLWILRPLNIVGRPLEARPDLANAQLLGNFYSLERDNLFSYKLRQDLLGVKTN